MRVLPQKFYFQPSLVVARQLLGKYLVREINGRRLTGKIVETEAYCGFDDKASHAACGLTERNSVMFEKGGYWYVYVVYGIFNCLNIVTEKKRFPSAVLIRALEPVEGIDEMGKNRGIEIASSPAASRNDKRGLCSGPGKLCQAMKIDRELNRTKAFGKGCQLWIENGENVRPSQIIASPRIGVDYAGKWSEKKWRFYVKNNQFVSKSSPAE